MFEDRDMDMIKLNGQLSILVISRRINGIRMKLGYGQTNWLAINPNNEPKIQ